MLILAEFKFQFFIRWFLFLGPYIGLGLFYIFVAIFTVGNGSWWQILVAAICGAIGFIYVMMGFVGQDRGITTAVITQQQARDATVGYAVSKASDMSASEKRAIMTTAMEEGRRNNPFENDNPFEKNNTRTAYN